MADRSTASGFNRLDADMIPYAQHFQYGSLSSQYVNLDAAAVARIEEAAMCCHLRDFQAGLQVLETLPPELSRHPAIVYEKSELCWYSWSLIKCEEILEEGLAWAERNVSDSSSNGVYTLLRIALGRTKACTHGNFIEARTAMREVRAWLLEVPVEQYTDVHVCIPYVIFRQNTL